MELSKSYKRELAIVTFVILCVSILISPAPIRGEVSMLEGTLILLFKGAGVITMVRLAIYLNQPALQGDS